MAAFNPQQMGSWHVIVLAGGHGSRMGGVSKGEVRVDGVRLVDLLLSTLRQVGPVGRTTVVHPEGITDLPSYVVQTTEEPAFGGPVAGIAAAVQLAAAAGAGADTAADATGAGHPSHTAVLAVDAPASPALLPSLWEGLSHSGADVCVVTSPDPAGGEPRIEPLCALWQTSSLEKALAAIGEPRDKAVFTLLRQVKFSTITGSGEQRDYDTLAELQATGDVTLPER